MLKTTEALAVLQQCRDSLKTIDMLDEDAFSELIKTVKTETNQKGKALFFPLRMALTGMLHGPELKHVMVLLEKEGCINRLEKAMNS